MLTFLGQTDKKDITFETDFLSLTHRRQSMHLFTQQTKELVRRKTEILVHGSEVDKVNQQESDDHFKQLTLRRMQTRGTVDFDYLDSNV